MTWFYANAGQQAGPISDIQLDEYILAGKILPDTLIWREGMENWQLCREVKSALLDKARPSAVIGAAAKFGGETVMEIVCAECGGLYPRENAIKQGDRWICAVCKPLHIQKVKEGVLQNRTGAMEYAGFGMRLLAKFLDSLIIGLAAGLLLCLVILVVVPPLAKTKGNGDTVVFVLLGTFALIVLGTAFYHIWFLSKYGGTPGKRMLGLRVVGADGANVSWGRAIGRFFGEWVTGMIPFWIGYLIAAFDPERRTVHDHIAGTRVIRV
jgi:uncharacterized RDD family membrane protein YckC